MQTELKGTRFTPDEIARFERLRKEGWSVARAAEKMNRSPSAFYNYEKRKRENTPREIGPNIGGKKTHKAAIRLVRAFINPDLHVMDEIRVAYGLKPIDWGSDEEESDGTDWDLIMELAGMAHEIAWEASDGRVYEYLKRYE